MTTMPVQEVKRRGMSVLDESLASGPVYVIRNNTPRYVVMFADAFHEMEESLAEARIAAAEADIKCRQSGTVPVGEVETRLPAASIGG